MLVSPQECTDLGEGEDTLLWVLSLSLVHVPSTALETLVGTLSLRNFAQLFLSIFVGNLQDLSFIVSTFHASDTEPRFSACHSIANNQDSRTGGRKGGLFKSWKFEKVADSHRKDHLNNWTLAGIFVRRERKERRGLRVLY